GTETGFAEARRHFPDLTVFYWPLDFSWAVRRALRAVRPTLVLLAEGELWPNLLAEARRRGVRVVVLNGRMSPGSYRNYRRLGWLGLRLARAPDLVLVQDDEY